MRGRVLILDAEPTRLTSLVTELERRGYATSLVSSVEDAVRTSREQTYDILLLSHGFLQTCNEDLGGLKNRVSSSAGLVVVEEKDPPDVSHIVGALRAGADDYIGDCLEPVAVADAVSRTLEARTLIHKLKRRTAAGSDNEPFGELIGESAAMNRLRQRLPRVAASDASVLITGESGTGKDVVARALHRWGPRAEGPFIAVNCAAVPEHLMESEFFGYTKGAFTDARDSRAGMLVRAHGGTLFLDEVSCMPLPMQAKLLRSLQQRTVRPIGHTSEIPFDAHIIAASNVDLAKEVARARFREDLFFRLDVVQLALAPLRDREQDVLLLAQHFVERAAASMIRHVVGLTPAAARALLQHHWPGNVRELENCIFAAVALARYDHVTEEDLPPSLQRRGSPPDDLRLRTLEAVEGEHIAAVLQAVGGNKARASRLLGLDRKTLYRKLRRYGLNEAEVPLKPLASTTPLEAEALHLPIQRRAVDS